MVLKDSWTKTWFGIKPEVIAKPSSLVVLNWSCSHISTVIQDAEKRNTRTNRCFKTNICRKSYKKVHQSWWKLFWTLYSFLTDVENLFGFQWRGLLDLQLMFYICMLLDRGKRCTTEFYLSGVHSMPLQIKFFLFHFSGENWKKRLV